MRGASGVESIFILLLVEFKGVQVNSESSFFGQRFQLTMPFEVAKLVSVPGGGGGEGEMGGLRRLPLCFTFARLAQTGQGRNTASQLFTLRSSTTNPILLPQPHSNNKTNKQTNKQTFGHQCRSSGHLNGLWLKEGMLCASDCTDRQQQEEAAIA